MHRLRLSRNGAAWLARHDQYSRLTHAHPIPNNRTCASDTTGRCPKNAQRGTFRAVSWRRGRAIQLFIERDYQPCSEDSLRSVANTSALLVGS
jgi:hypothetical protein